VTVAELPPWPAKPVAYGPVVLREFADRDVPMVMELSTDPYVPLIGTLPADASQQQAQEWIERQRSRRAEAAGFSVAIAEADTDGAVGGINLMLAALARGASYGRLFRRSERPRARHRVRGSDGADFLRVEHPGPPPN
jgi:hypothetical protein